MAYNKAIIVGNYLDLYQYEHRPRNIDGQLTRGRTRPTRSESLPSDREDVRESFTKRRKDNTRRSSLAFVRIVKSNLGHSENPLLVTLTYRKNETDLTVGYRDFHIFIKTLRGKFGSDFKYVAVPEFQKRGAVHFHALFWGLPSELVLSERGTRTVHKAWGWGYVFLKHTDGNEKLSHYLAKYMAKAFSDFRSVGRRAYVASRNINRPIVLSDFSPVWPVLEDWCGDNPALQTKEYLTQYLGKGRFTRYKIKIE